MRRCGAPRAVSRAVGRQQARRYSTAAATAAPAVRSIDPAVRVKEEVALAGRAEVALVKNIISGLNLARTKGWCGQNLTRRERIAVSNSFADAARLVPLSGVVIVPFAELALPWLANTFPSLVPSSHVPPTIAELRAEKRETQQREISKHLLTEAEHEMAHAKGDAATAFQKLMREGGRALHVRDFHPLMKFFNQHFGLKHLSHAKLQAIASFFGVHTEGTDSFLRASILARLAELREDDALIHEQGVDTLTNAELRDALIARGTPVTGKSREERLKALREWLHLAEHSLTPYLLVLSRADAYSEDELKHATEALEEAHLAEKRATSVAGLVQNL